MFDGAKIRNIFHTGRKNGCGRKDVMTVGRTGGG